MRKILSSYRGVVVHSSLFFYFQAEDGIRDLTVTGVQTCALPICLLYGGSSTPCVWPCLVSTSYARFRARPSATTRSAVRDAPSQTSWHVDPRSEIGRASCRERV